MTSVLDAEADRLARGFLKKANFDRRKAKILREIHTTATHIYLTSQLTTTYEQATSIFTLGHYAYPAQNAVSDPQQISRYRYEMWITEVLEGQVTHNGLATTWALVDEPHKRLLVAGRLEALSIQMLTAGNTFTLERFPIQW
jgi:hypothetical protein